MIVLFSNSYLGIIPPLEDGWAQCFLSIEHGKDDVWHGLLFPWQCDLIWQQWLNVSLVIMLCFIWLLPWQQACFRVLLSLLALKWVAMSLRATKNWILPTTWVSLEADHSPVKPQMRPQPQSTPCTASWDPKNRTQLSHAQDPDSQKL